MTNPEVTVPTTTRPHGRPHGAELALDIAEIHRLGPVEQRKWWIAGGLGLHLLGVGAFVAWAYARYHAYSAAHLTSKMIFAVLWQEALHTGAGLAVVLLAGVFVIAGSVLIARPFVQSVAVLVLVVPIAAAVGFLAFGGLVLFVAVAWVLAASSGSNYYGNGAARRRKRAAASGQ